MTLGVRLVTGERVLDFVIRWPVPLHRVLQNVLRHVDQRRAGTASRCDVECLTNDHWQVVCRHDEFVVLGDAARDADGVALLECVGADRRSGNLTRNADHRDRVHVGVTQRRDHVRCCRSARHHGDTRSTSDVCVSLSHVTSTLFVANEDVADRRLDERVVRRQDATARQPEHDVYVFHLQGANQCLGTGDLLTGLWGLRLLLGTHGVLRWLCFWGLKKPPDWEAWARTA